MDPILSHGSTLGLYEVLIGKPYICDMITDSVVHCFFIEAEKIDELRHSDPSIEVFLWQVYSTDLHWEVCITESISNGNQLNGNHRKALWSLLGFCFLRYLRKWQCMRSGFLLLKGPR